jgi:hypothetical protein
LSGGYLWRGAGTFDPNGHKVTADNSGGYNILGGFNGTSALYDLDIIPAVPAIGQAALLYTAIDVARDLMINGGATHAMLVKSDTPGTPRALTVGGDLSMPNSVTFTDVAPTVTGTTSLTAGKTLKAAHGLTFTSALWSIGAGCTLNSDDGANQATIAKSGGGTVTFGAGCVIDYLIGSPAATFLAPGCTDGGHNTDILFASPDPVSYTLTPSRGRWSVTGEGSTSFTGVLATISALTGKVLVVTNVSGYMNVTSIITLRDGTTLLAEWKRDVSLEGPSFNFKGRWILSGSTEAVAAIVSGALGCRLTLSGYTLG